MLKNSRGIATLEMALVGTVLLGILLGGIGVIDYLEQLRFVNLIVERELDDSGIKPLKIVGDAAALSFDSGAVGSYLAAVVNSVQLDLIQRYPSLTEVWIEARACAVDIDPQSGASLGVSLPSCLVQSVGSLPVSANSKQDTDLLKSFADQAAAVQSDALGHSMTASLLAVPSGTFGRGGGEAEYLDKAVMAGLRVFVSLEKTLAGSAYHQFGSDLIAYNYRIVNLRGVLE